MYHGAGILEDGEHLVAVILMIGRRPVDVGQGAFTRLQLPRSCLMQTLDARSSACMFSPLLQKLALFSQVKLPGRFISL